jgi:hypothetical protein
MSNSISRSAAVILGIFSLFSLTSAHVRLVCPVPLTADSGLKSGACGAVADPGKPATQISPGLLPIVMEETVFHTGAPFRLALMSTDAIINSARADFTPTCTYVLLNHIPHKSTSTGSNLYTITVEIPDVNCQNCALQLIQVMTDKISSNLPGRTSCTYNPSSTNSWTNNQCGSNYHSCAKISISGKNSFSSLCPNGNTIAYASPNGWGFTSTGLIYQSNENANWNASGMLVDTRVTNPSFRSIPAGTQCSSSAISAVTQGQAVNNNPTSTNNNSESASPSGSNGNAAGIAVGVIFAILGVFFLGSYGYYLSKPRTEGYVPWMKSLVSSSFNKSSNPENYKNTTQMNMMK